MNTMYEYVKDGIKNTYLQTEQGKNLKLRLDKLNNITIDERNEIIAIKAEEYDDFYNNPNNVWECVKLFLKEFPEIFDIIDIITSKEPIEKYYFVINSNCSDEMEKIFKYKNLDFKKVNKFINNKHITFYYGYLKYPKTYSLNINPIRQVWNLAEESGIKVGHYIYPQWEGAYYSMGLYRSFPIKNENDYGDYSRAKGGLRTDLGLGFKSAWEANIARILNYKGLRWDYEGCSFSVETGRYFPDFIVYNNADKYKDTIIEVKGMWDSQSLKKMWSFIHKYPEKNLIIIDQDYYMLIQEKYKNLIKNWEPCNNRRYQLIPIVGITISNRLKVIEKLKEGDELFLKREFENQYDKYAIKVVSKNREEVGYISKEWAAILSLKMDIGIDYKASLNKKHLNKKYLDVRVEMVSKIDCLNKIGL